MDFLCFTANCGQQFAVKIADLHGVIDNLNITRIPGPQGAVVGMTVWRGDLLPVVDIALLYSGVVGDSHYMLILDGEQRFGLLVESVHDIVRNEVPSDVRFMDTHDFETSVLTYDHAAPTIELF